MTRKDFTVVAQTIKDVIQLLQLNDKQAEKLANEFCVNLKTTNVNFDCNRFARACSSK